MTWLFFPESILWNICFKY